MIPDTTTFKEKTCNLLSPSMECALACEQAARFCGSPLLWTMVHPSSSTWQAMYAWNRPLDEYIPHTVCQIFHSKPVFISYALWNVRGSPDFPVITSCKFGHSNTRTSDFKLDKTLAPQSIQSTIGSSLHTVPQPAVPMSTMSTFLGNSTTECKEQLIKNCSIMVSDGHFLALLTKGNLTAQNPSTTNIHHRSLRDNWVLISQPWNCTLLKRWYQLCYWHFCHHHQPLHVSLRHHHVTHWLILACLKGLNRHSLQAEHP